MIGSNNNSAPRRVIAAVTAMFSTLLWLFAFPAYTLARTEVAALPGLTEGFVPQGITYAPGEDAYLLCGYMDDETASRLYVLRDGDVTGIRLQKANGDVYTGHAGGVTAAGAYVYISNAQKLFVLNLRDVLSAENGDTLAFIGSVPVPCRASFCSNDGTTLYVGEYHDVGYETDETHAVRTPDGSDYQALVFGYRLDADAPFGLHGETPTSVYAICDRTQGFAMTPDGQAILSTNCAQVLKSRLQIYDCAGAADGVFSLNGSEIPLYALDAKRLTKDKSIPSRSEDIEYDDGDVVIVFESAAEKYDGPTGRYAEDQIVRLTVSRFAGGFTGFKRRLANAFSAPAVQ